MIPPPTPKVVVIQDGGRLHYALPVALQRAGMLSAVFTDYYIKRRSPAAAAAALVGKFKPQIARRMMARRNDELPDAKVYSNLWMTFRKSRQRATYPTIEAYWEAYALAVKDWVLRTGMGDATAITGFIRSIHPTLCAAARQRGLRVVADQMIAPMPIEQAQAALQRQRFPGWERQETSTGWQIMDRIEKETWPLADHITCASDYVRTGLLSQGIPADRITVLPYPIDTSHFPVTNRQNRPGPLTVGFVGQVGLRKGAPYFFQVAQKLANSSIRFVMVGGASLNPDIIARHHGPVEMIGSVPRPEVKDWLARFDILLFPSTCEGSAGSVMEALATGLPIITSPNSGSVVRDGIEGFIRPYDDVDAMAACIQQLAQDPQARQQMSLAARKRAQTFNLDWYSQNLRAVFGTRAALHS